MWKSAAVALISGLSAAPAFAADTYKFEPDHTSAIFTYEHFGLSHPSGKIMGAKGTLVLDDDPTKDVVDVSLDMNTMTTALPDFDTMLKGKDYFDVAQFPTATFKSTSVVLTTAPAAAPTAAGDTTDADAAPKTAPQTADVTGDMTIHGITKSVVLHVSFNKKAFNPALFKTGYGFTATAHLQRSDFDLKKYEPFVGDDIDLVIEAEAF